MKPADIIHFPRPASEQRLTWNTLLAMTHDLLESAKRGDWTAALSIQQQRRPLLEHYFQSHPELIDKKSLADGIRVMLNLDAEVAVLAADQQAIIRQEASNNYMAGAVAQVYLRHQGL